MFADWRRERLISFSTLMATVVVGTFLFSHRGAAAEPGAGPREALSASAAAQKVAAALVEGLRAKLPTLPAPAALARLAGPAGKDIQAFEQALFTELARLGVSLVDRKAVEKLLQDAGLAGAAPEAVVEKLRGRIGAKILVVGSVLPVQGTLLANIRAVSTTDGKVLAAAEAAFSLAVSEPAAEVLTLRARLRRLSDRLVAALDRLDGELRYQRIAVFPFEEAGETTRKKELGRLVTAELITRLGGEHRLLLVERAELDKVIKELELGMTGAVEPERAAQAGRLAGAQAIVLGAVAEAGNRYLVTARVVASESGKVQAAEQEELPAADLIALSSEAVVLRSTWGAVYRSVLLPGWGQLYNRQPAKAAVFAGAELAAVGLILGFHFQGAKLEDEYRSLPAGTGADVFADKAAQAERAFEWRNGFIYALVGIHVINVLDALVNGKDFQSAAPGVLDITSW